MTIHVTISEAEKRLAALVDAALHGEDVVLAVPGLPHVKLIPVAAIEPSEDQRIADQRRDAFGMLAKEFEGVDLSLRALKQDRTDWDERNRLKFGDHP